MHERLVENNIRVALPKQRTEPPGRSRFAMIEKSSFRHKERPDTGRGDKRAFSMPFQQLRLGLTHIRSSESWDQLLRCPGIQRRNDHPVRLHACCYGFPM